MSIPNIRHWYDAGKERETERMQNIQQSRHKDIRSLLSRSVDGSVERNRDLHITCINKHKLKQNYIKEIIDIR